MACSSKAHGLASCSCVGAASLAKLFQVDTGTSERLNASCGSVPADTYAWQEVCEGAVHVRRLLSIKASYASMLALDWADLQAAAAQAPVRARLALLMGLHRRHALLHNDSKMSVACVMPYDWFVDCKGSVHVAYARSGAKQAGANHCDGMKCSLFQPFSSWKLSMGMGVYVDCHHVRLILRVQVPCRKSSCAPTTCAAQRHPWHGAASHTLQGVSQLMSQVMERDAWLMQDQLSSYICREQRKQNTFFEAACRHRCSCRRKLQLLASYHRRLCCQIRRTRACCVHVHDLRPSGRRDCQCEGPWGKKSRTRRTVCRIAAMLFWPALIIVEGRSSTDALEDHPTSMHHQDRLHHQARMRDSRRLW